MRFLSATRVRSPILRRIQAIWMPPSDAVARRECREDVLRFADTNVQRAAPAITTAHGHAFDEREGKPAAPSHGILFAFYCCAGDLAAGACLA